MVKKVALYCRVSMDSQVHAIENQRMILVDYAKRNNLLYDIYTEVESSRKTRYQKYQLMMKLRSGEYSTVIVTKLDRWGRTLTELVLELNEFVTKGIGFISINDGLDLTTTNGRLMAGLLSVLADWERDINSERTKAGIARARSQNKVIGRPSGRKDHRPRKKSGYIIAAAKRKQKTDITAGVIRPLEEYLS